METITKIKAIGLKKMNNAEYENFMTRFRALVAGEGKESETPEEISLYDTTNYLGVPEEKIAAFDADNALLVDLVNQSHVSDETAQMLEADKRRNGLLVYLTSSVTQKAKSPLLAQQAPARTVYNIIKPYIGIYASPNQQKTAQIEGLLIDIAKPGLPEHIRTLGLDEIVSSLRDTNKEYATLTSQRTQKKAAQTKENSHAVRLRMDALYDQMSTIVFARSISSPTSENARFVNELNALISETSALYKQRTEAAKAAKKPRK